MSYKTFFSKLLDPLVKEEDDDFKQEIERPAETENREDDSAPPPETELPQTPLPFVGEEEDIASKEPEVEMFSYGASFLALKEEIKRQNRSQEKTNERLEMVLEETKQFKQDYQSRLESLEAEREEAAQNAVTSLIKSLLPALDGLDFAVKNARKNWKSIQNETPPLFHKAAFFREKEAAQARLSGLVAVMERFRDWLSEAGASPIHAEEAPFDPRLMKALDSKIDPDRPHNTVIEVVRRGYQLDDLILRPAEVIVSINSDSAPTEEN